MRRDTALPPPLSADRHRAMYTRRRPPASGGIRYVAGSRGGGEGGGGRLLSPGCVVYRARFAASRGRPRRGCCLLSLGARHCFGSCSCSAQACLFPSAWPCAVDLLTEHALRHAGRPFSSDMRLSVVPVYGEREGRDTSPRFAPDDKRVVEYDSRALDLVGAFGGNKRRGSEVDAARLTDSTQRGQ
jgi:hypothetical protein